jgi:hypothetical protein
MVLLLLSACTGKSSTAVLMRTMWIVTLWLLSWGFKLGWDGLEVVRMCFIG